MESLQLLKDEHIKPTDNVIADCLGKTNTLYHNLLEELKGYDITLMDWRYYMDGKAWLSKGEYKWTTVRGTQKVKPIFWISICSGFFKISFNFSEKTKEKLLALPLSASTKEWTESCMPNGNKVKYIPIIFDVIDEKQFADIITLAQFKKEVS